jgi:uncharacterized membrane protein YdjX (TVP38/TMEM64 family)
MNKYKRLIFVLLFFTVLILLTELTGLRDHFSLALLRDKLNDNLATGLLLFVLLFCIGNLIHIPGLVFLAAAVLTLGRFNGALATYLAAVTSCAFTYGFIHYLGGDALRQIDNKIANRLLAHLDAYPIRNVALLRTLFQTLPAINYALAISGVGFRNYMIGTVLGLPLPIGLYCFFFSELQNLITK